MKAESTCKIEPRGTSMSWSWSYLYLRPNKLLLHDEQRLGHALQMNKDASCPAYDASFPQVLFSVKCIFLQ